jgi:hypothetical protein
LLTADVDTESALAAAVKDLASTTRENIAIETSSSREVLIDYFLEEIIYRRAVS